MKKAEYIWVTRDNDYYEHPEDCHLTKGLVKLFYDSPLRDGNTWGFARKICDLPSYTYPEVTWEGGPVKFISEVGQLSDGYHTFDELYEYRMLYNAMLFNELAKENLYDIHKSKRHSDGDFPFDNPDYFIVMAELPTGQISNHYRMEYWDFFKIPEKYKSNEWDGHDSQDVAQRMKEFLKKY